MKKPLACFAALRSFASFALTYLSFLERIPFSQSSQSSQRTAKLAKLAKDRKARGVGLVSKEGRPNTPTLSVTDYQIASGTTLISLTLPSLPGKNALVVVS